MTHKLMISYSRSQTPFVNRFYQELADAGYSIWLDYRSIVPARPWLDQIQEGIAWADTVLLVVSKESIISSHVEEEWSLALQEKKRVILIIFDAVDLSKYPQLREHVWVDFRLKHRPSLERLKALLEGTEPEGKSSKKESHTWGTDTPPEKGFKASPTFWIAFLLSFLVVASSIPTWWTIFIPYVLAPLPLQIYKRNYSLSRVMPALLFMPVFWLFTVAALANEGSILSALNANEDATAGWFVLSLLASWLLLGLLLTPAIQRRARPEAARVRFARKSTPSGAEGEESVPFVIECAPEDMRYADELRRGLINQGHVDAAKERRMPEAVFVLVSSYNKKTSNDPGQVAVYPILLQAVQDLAENLARIQWIDFRRGIHNTNKLARLLRKPDELLKEVAIAPTGTQEIFPPVVNALQYFYLLTGILGGGGLLLYLISFVQLLLQQKVALDEEQVVNFVSLAALGIVLFGAVLYSVRALRTREGGSADYYPLLILTIIQTAIQVSFFAFAGAFSETEILYNTVDSVMLPAFVFILGLVIVLPFLLFRWRELQRWLPIHTMPPTDRLELALLLYTPPQKGRLIYHLLFHICLLVGYFFFILSLFYKSPDVIYCMVIPLVFLMLGIRWLVWRAERKTAAALAR
jgi:hypothetical protein